tara:strand:+ start:1009 stop:1830 length:822 start_codon:yes stop_codon:yes gene_type:complete
MRFIFISFLFFSSFIHSVELEELSYGDHVKQKIDFYPGSTDKVLVWIHGGGWIFSGKRETRWIRRLERYFKVNEELNIFSIGYRYGRNTAPQAADDTLCAYKFISEEVKKRGLSEDDVTLMGLSAGGHLALLTGFKNSGDSNFSCKASIVPKAIINFFGIVDIESNFNFLKENRPFLNYINIWIPPDKTIKEISKEYSPIEILHNQIPKVVTVHGTDDTLVPYSQALLLDDALQQNHLLITVEGGDHWRFTDKEHMEIKKQIDEFMISDVWIN